MVMSKDMGGLGAGGRGGSGAISVRSKSVDTGTKRMVKKQNKAADSYRIKDLDALEKGRIARQKAKLAADAAAKKQSNKDKAKGAAAATAGIAGGIAVVGGAKAKADSKLTPKATKSARTPSTMSAAEIAAAKKIAIKKTTTLKKPLPKLSKSERDFLAGQKLKQKITKKTGIYPNTAN